MSEEAPVLDTRPGLVTMLLAAEVIEPLTWMVIGGLPARMAGIRAITLAGMCMTVAVVVVIGTLSRIWVSVMAVL